MIDLILYNFNFSDSENHMGLVDYNNEEFYIPAGPSKRFQVFPTQFEAITNKRNKKAIRKILLKWKEE